MTYHPIMGISIFIISLIIAYYLGTYIAKKYKSSKNIGKKLKKTDLGDAAAPDAPWMDKKKKN